MADEDRDPPSRPSRTGRHRAVGDDWTTQKRVVDKAERASREEAKHRGALEIRTAKLENVVGPLESLCDVHTTQLTLHAHRLTEGEKDVTALQAQLERIVAAHQLESKETREAIAKARGALSTLVWLIPLLVGLAIPVTSAITYIVSRK